ncbi:UNKNOWN [Stylonychia lemnae]|uniref:Cyclic nucleotide-binding domain-containing protein n=1 Tax=Stylonychia lemnae TaxID=5949 RepID=A0A078AMW8_STYLE|nr:UNKNOWN [Stylonychia lemnae]|eukprot:CDW83271.1 UNKNOWN [Stylonychia lemnae]
MRCPWFYYTFFETAAKKQRRQERRMHHEVKKLEENAGGKKIQRIQELWRIARTVYLSTGFLKRSKDSISKKQVRGSLQVSSVFSQETIYSFIILPENRLKLFWDTCCSALLFISIIQVMFCIAFQLKPFENVRVFELAIDCILITDQLFTFFTSYYYKKKLIHKPQKIIRKYLTGFFIIDCFANMPMLSITKWSKLNQARTVEWFSFLKIILYILLFIHFEACLLSYFGVAFDDFSWIDIWGIERTNLGEIYLCGLYTTLVTFVTVGYGDFSATTTYECIIFMSLELAGISVFSLMIRTVQNFMSNHSQAILSDKQDGLETWLIALNRKSKNTQVIRPRDIRSIQRFFEVYYRRSPLYYFDTEFYNDLSIQAKNKLVKTITKPYKKMFKFFFEDLDHSYKASNVFVRDILASLFLQIYEPKKTIIAFKENVTEISFIYQGGVVIYDKNTDRSIVQYGQGSYIGDFQIFFEIRSNFRYVSADVTIDTHLMCINKDRLMTILKDHPTEQSFLTLRAKKRYVNLKKNRNIARKEEIQNHFKQQRQVVQRFGSSQMNATQSKKEDHPENFSFNQLSLLDENTIFDAPESIGEIDPQQETVDATEEYFGETKLELELEISDDERSQEHFRQLKLNEQMRLTAKKYDRVRIQLQKINSLTSRLNETVAQSYKELNDAILQQLIMGKSDKLENLRRTIRFRNQNLIQEIEITKSKTQSIIKRQTIDFDEVTLQTSSLHTDSSLIEEIKSNETDEGQNRDSDRVVAEFYAFKNHLGTYKKKGQVQFDQLKKVNYFKQMYIEKKDKKKILKHQLTTQHSSKKKIVPKKIYYGGKEGGWYGINSDSEDSWSLQKREGSASNSIRTSFHSDLRQNSQLNQQPSLQEMVKDLNRISPENELEIQTRDMRRLSQKQIDAYIVRSNASQNILLDNSANQSENQDQSQRFISPRDNDDLLILEEFNSITKRDKLHINQKQPKLKEDLIKSRSNTSAIIKDELEHQQIKVNKIQLTEKMESEEQSQTQQTMYNLTPALRNPQSENFSYQPQKAFTKIQQSKKIQPIKTNLLDRYPKSKNY